MQFLENERQFTTDEAEKAVESVYGTPRFLTGILSPKNQKMIDHGKLQLKLYSPCGCNSGKNYKFCCLKKIKETDEYFDQKNGKLIINTDA